MIGDFGGDEAFIREEKVPERYAGTMSRRRRQKPFDKNQPIQGSSRYGFTAQRIHKEP